MLDPATDVQQFVVDVVMEVVETYTVDGVHLDYVRYPSRRFGYHPESISPVCREYGFDPMAVEQDAVRSSPPTDVMNFSAVSTMGRLAPRR